MPDLDVGKFCKLLGMLGSRHDGEVTNAASLATRMLREAGLTWLGLVGSIQLIDKLMVENEQLKTALRRRQDTAYTESAADYLRRRQNTAYTESADDYEAAPDHRSLAAHFLDLSSTGEMRLSAWETDFLKSIKMWWGPLTERQQAVFNRIRERADA